MINRMPNTMASPLWPPIIRATPSTRSPTPPQRKRTLSKNDQPAIVSGGFGYSSGMDSGVDMIPLLAHETLLLSGTTPAAGGPPCGRHASAYRPSPQVRPDSAMTVPPATIGWAPSLPG